MFRSTRVDCLAHTPAGLVRATDSFITSRTLGAPATPDGPPSPFHRRVESRNGFGTVQSGANNHANTFEITFRVGHFADRSFVGDDGSGDLLTRRDWDGRQ